MIDLVVLYIRFAVINPSGASNVRKNKKNSRKVFEDVKLALVYNLESNIVETQQKETFNLTGIQLMGCLKE